MPRLATTFLSITFFLAPVTVLGTTYIVNPAGTGDFPTIQEAINATVDGDTVLLADGTYTGVGNRGLLCPNRLITIRSQSGNPAACIIDAEGADRGIRFQSTTYRPLLEGVTITNGRANIGAGALFWSDAQATISHCVFCDNYTETSAGAAVFSSDSRATMSHDVIYKNYAETSGGAGVVHFEELSHAFVNNCSITHNDVGDAYGTGAAVFCSNADPYFDNCIISFTDGGPAIACASGGDPSMSCNDVYGNSGGDYVDCISGDAGINGNFSSDPLYCDPLSDDFHLDCSSPCVCVPGCGATGLVGALPAGCGSGYGRVWHVPADAPTIQAGLDSAGYCDTVVVACGTYYEHDIEMKSGVVLMSETGEAGCVTVDAQQLGRVFHGAYLDQNTLIEGFTITGGWIGAAHGAGMYLESSSPTIRRCVVSENTAAGAAYDAGAVYMRFSTPLFDHCSFLDNTAGDDAGAVYCRNESHAVFDHCIFAGNTCSDLGGAILCWGGADPALGNCTFYGNSGGIGGGIAIANDSHVTMVGNIVSFSTAGSAVDCDGTGTLLLFCSDIYGNAGGDYVGCISGMEGTNGNISEDPQFCDAPDGDFGIDEGSPCVYISGCPFPEFNPVGAGEVGCDVVSVEPSETGSLPSRFYLGPAIPNPFNPITEIEYGIPAGAASAVTMKVYDARGRRVTTLVDAVQAAGTYRVVWDGRDHKGSAAASGVYFYRITWNGKSETRRMVLLK